LLLLRGPAAVHLQIRTFESSEEGKADLFLFLKDIRDDQVLSLLERYYHDEVWQWRVVSALGNFPGQRAGGLLLRAVTSKHDHIQAQAIVSLGEIRCALAVKPLCDLLMNPKSQELGWQSQLLVALGRIGSKEAIPVIARFLHAPQELRRSVLRDAIEAISTIGGAESVPVLMDLYRHVRPDQQESIILAVAKARGEVAEKFLETIAADDSEYLRLRRIARDNLKDHKGLVPRHEPSGGYWSVGDPEGINEVR
jgi:HEAT repeat protein